MKTNTNMARVAFRYGGGLAALFILFTGKLDAQQPAEEKPVMQVTYQRDEPDYLVFQVNIQNTGTKRTALRISDNRYDLLYSEFIYPGIYSKTIKVPKYDMDAVEFRITNGKEVVKKVFDVKHSTKVSFEVTEAEK